MSESHDAYLSVDVPLPNGTIAHGRPIPWRTALQLLELSDAFTKGADPKQSLMPLLEQFQTLTGIDEAYLLSLCPDLSLGELIGIVNSFFYSRRTGPAKQNGKAEPMAPAGT